MKSYPSTNNMYPKNNKGFAHFLVLFLVVLVIGILGYFSLQKGLFKFRPSNFDSSPTLPQTREDNMNNVVDENLPPGWKTFTNNELGFSVNYPPDYKIGGAVNSNSVFVSPDTDKIKMTNNLYGRMVISHNGSFRETDVLTQLSIGEKYYQPSEDNFESRKGDYVSLTRVEDTKLGSNIAQTLQGDIEDTPIIIYILPHPKGNLFIEITWWAIGTRIDDSQPEFLKTFDQILSTFKFVEISGSTKVPIMKEFEGKIVYGTSLQIKEIELAKKDCINRNGIFNACGNICEPDSAGCAEVCAATCEF